MTNYKKIPNDKFPIKTFLLALIVFLAAFLRFYKLGQVPAGLEWDEVAIGYDAYSILKTGRDQFGQFLPITFRSLDDYKPPLFEYLAIPPIALFGLNAFSVRFPSAFFGTLSVLMTYFLVKELFEKNSFDATDLLALLSSFLLAISPWHLQFSRAAFEVNLSVFVILVAVWSFLRGLKNQRWFYLTALFSGLGLFSYHSTRVVLPLLIIFLTVVFWKKRPKFKKLIGPILVFLIFLIPYLTIFFSPKTQMRLRVTGITNLFNNLDTQRQTVKNLQIDKAQATDLTYRFFHGNKITLIKTVFDNYIVHFNPGFLFIHADVILHHAPDFGLLYRTEALFLLIGFIAYFKKYANKKCQLLLFWFFIAPIPAAVTLQVPHAVRTELFLPTWQVFTAIGFYETFSWIKENYKRLFYPALLIIVMIFSLDFATYLHQYYVHTNQEVAKYWLYGRKEAVEYTEAAKDKYDQIIVSWKLEMPHVAWLFYTKYDPAKYLAEGGTVSGGWANYDNHFDKYKFQLIERYGWQNQKNTLFVDSASEAPEEAKPLKTIFYPNGEPALVIWESSSRLR